jgi:glucose-1-phosphate adenylyltransferase
VLTIAKKRNYDMLKVTAMILAGGRGKRMGFLSQERPKPVLPFAGKFRVIDFSLSNCIHSQIDNIALLIDYQRSQMSDYLRRWNLTNTSISKFDILEPKEGSYLGTADAIYQNLGHLQKCGTDRVLVLAGDHVYKMDYRKMLAFHEQMKADVTVGVVRVPVEQAHRFGTISTDAEGRIIDFTEKASMPISSLASMGIYVFNNDVLARRLVEDAAQANSPHDFGYAVIPRMVEKDRVYAFEFDGYWQDIGNIEAYYWANMELTREKPSFSLDGTWPILTENHNSSLLSISRQGTVRNSLISPGCVIKGRVENSVLSPGVRIEEEAVVTNSLLMANVYIGYHSVVNHCVLDEGVNVGKFCYVGFRTGPISGNDGITVVGKDVTVPQYIAIGHNCKILPNVQPADFLSAVVTSDSIVAPR